MGYTPHNWDTGEVITADRLNSIEHGVATASESGGYDAEVIFYHDDDSSHDWQVTVVSGTFAHLMELVGQNIAPIILVRYWNEMDLVKGASTAVCIYGVYEDDDPPFLTFTAHVPTALYNSPFTSLGFTWNANDEVY